MRRARTLLVTAVTAIILAGERQTQKSHRWLLFLATPRKTKQGLLLVFLLLVLCWHSYLPDQFMNVNVDGGGNPATLICGGSLDKHMQAGKELIRPRRRNAAQLLEPGRAIGLRRSTAAAGWFDSHTTRKCPSRHWRGWP